MKVQFVLLAFSLFSSAFALPTAKRDSSIDEPAVISPNGTPITLTPGAEPTNFDNSNSNPSSCPSGDCNSSKNCPSGNCDTTSTMDATSTMKMDSTSTTMMETSTMTEDTSTMMDTTSTTMMDTTTMTADATSTSWMTTATYGSGYTPSGYDSCVQQCMASYAPPPSMVTATPSYPPSYNNGASGTGVTHTVIVAPTQGVLRYVPFAVNASVGDTVRFIWGAGPHTVTKSSQFNLCNTSSDSPFKSGKQNKSFVFDQQINDTNPTFYYCGIPTHCEKGMFGVINPPNAQPGAQNSAQGMMAMMAQNNSDVAAQWSYTMMSTQNNTAASTWGMNMDITSMTTDPQAQLALLQNVMFTRLTMAQNTKFVTSSGGFNPDISAGMSVPMDPTKFSSSNTTSPSSASGNAANSPSGSTTGSTAPTASSSTGGASRRVASSATAIIAAIAIAALAL